MYSPFRILGIWGFMLLWISMAWAATPESTKNSTSLAANASTPASISTTPSGNATTTITSQIPLDIQSQGNDAVGSLLGFKLKETVLGSTFFALTPEGKRFVVRLMSKPEFPDRPKLSSVYAAAVYFQEAPDVLPYFLDLRPGVVDADSIQAEVQILMDWVANISKRFNYLLSN